MFTLKIEKNPMGFMAAGGADEGLINNDGSPVSNSNTAIQTTAALTGIFSASPAASTTAIEANSIAFGSALATFEIDKSNGKYQQAVGDAISALGDVFGVVGGMAGALGFEGAATTISLGGTAVTGLGIAVDHIDIVTAATNALNLVDELGTEADEAFRGDASNLEAAFTSVPGTAVEDVNSIETGISNALNAINAAQQALGTSQEASDESSMMVALESLENPLTDLYDSTDETEPSITTTINSNNTLSIADGIGAITSIIGAGSININGGVIDGVTAAQTGGGSESQNETVGDSGLTDVVEGTNSSGVVQYTQTILYSYDGDVTATVSGTGAAVALTDATITLSPGTIAGIYGAGNTITAGTGSTVTISGNDNNLTLANNSSVAFASGTEGNSVTVGGVTFDQGSFGGDSLSVTDNALSTTLITAPDANGNSYSVATLSLNISTGLGTVTLLPDGTVLNITASGGDPSAPTAGETALQVLLSDLSGLGGPSSAAALEAADIAYQHKPGTAYTLSPSLVAPQDSNTSALVEYSLPNGALAGAVIAGQDTASITVSGSPETVPATNELDTNGNTDLSVDSISGIQTLDTSGSDIVDLTAGQMGGFSEITGGASSLIAVGPGAFSLAASNVDQSADYASLSATSVLGTQLTGNGTADQELAASTLGNDTLTAGNGAGDILVAGEGVDNITGGTGGDTFEVDNSLAAGTVLTGHGTRNILEAEGDLTGAVNSGTGATLITGIQTLDGSGTLALTASQFAQFSGVVGSFTLNAATGGTYNLASDTGTSIVDMTALSDDGTTLVGNVGDEILTASDSGNDTLTGAGTDDTLIAGSGVDTLTGGSGSTTFEAEDGLASGSSVTGNGTGNVLEADGDISGATISGVQTLDIQGNVTVTQSQLASFTLIEGSGDIDVASAGTFDLATSTAGTGTPFDLSAESDSGTTLIGNSAAAETLTASDSGNDTLEAGNGGGNTLYAGGGNDTLTGGNGGYDTLVAGSGVDSLTGGTGSDNTFIASNGLASGSSLASHGTADTFEADGNITGATITGNKMALVVEADPEVPTDGLTLDYSQLGDFSSFGGTGAIFAATGGTYNLGTASLNMTALSNSATTLEETGATGVTLTANASGNDTLSLSDGSDNTLTAAGSTGNITLKDLGDTGDTLIGGSGTDTYVLDSAILTGTTIAGGSGAGTISVTGDAAAVCEATFSNIQTLTTSVNGLYLTAAQMASLTNLDFTGGAYTLNAATAGTYDLLAVNNGATANTVYLTASDEAGGTTLIGNNANGDVLTSSFGSGDVLTEGSGAGDTLNLWGTNITANSGNGVGDTLNFYGTNDTNDTGSVASGLGDTLNLYGVNVKADSSSSNNIYYANYVKMFEGTATIKGEGGYNIYDVYDDLGSGNNVDTINNYHTGSNSSELYFANGDTPSEVVLTQQGENLVVTVIGAPDQVVIVNYFESSAYQLPIDFANGTSWNSQSTITSMIDYTPVTLTDGSSTPSYDTSGTTVDGGNDDYLELSGGSAETVNFSGSGNTVSDDASSTDDVLSDSSSGSGNHFYLHSIGSVATMNGSSDHASIYGNYNIAADASGSTGNSVYDYGSDDSVTLNGSSDTANIFTTDGGGSNDAVTLAGSSDSVSDSAASTGNSFAVTGSSDGVDIGGASESAKDLSTDSHNTFYLNGSGDSATLNGTNDTATLFGSNQSVTLAGSSESVLDSDTSTGNSFAITSSHDTVAIQGAGETASDLASDSDDTFYLYGDNDTAILNGTGDTAVLFGSDKSVYANGNSADVYDGGGDDDNLFVVSGSHDTATLSGDDYATYDGTSDSYNAFNLYGTGDTATLNGAGDTGTLGGNSESVTVNGNSATLSDWSTRSGNSFTLNSSNDTVSPAGSDDTASDTSGDSGNAFNLYGASDTATLNGTSDSAVLAGGSDSVTANGGSATLSDWGTATGNRFTLNSGNDTVSLDGSGDNATDATGDTGNRFNFYGTNNSATVGGSSDTGTLNMSGDSVTVSGGSDSFSVNGASDTVSDTSTASGNNFHLNGSSETATLSGAGDTIAFYGTSESATISGSSGNATFGGSSSVLAITGASSESVYFNSGATGTLQLEAPAGFTGTVAGLSDSDAIDLTSFQYSGTPTISSVTGTGAANTDTVVTITDDGISTQLALLNQYANQFAVTSSAYTLTADGTGTSAGTLFQLAAGH